MSRQSSPWLTPLLFAAAVGALPLGSGLVRSAPGTCMETCIQRVFVGPYARVGQQPPPMLCRDPYEQHCATRCASPQAAEPTGAAP